MPTSVFSSEIQFLLGEVQAAASRNSIKRVQIGSEEKMLPYPFPSPADWRDCWIYFLMIDRFNNPDAAPASAWNQRYDFRQGGTFKGVQQQLPYIATLGARAIWLSPVLKNSRPEGWAWNYHGYATQDFLSIDGRFASDGTSATAEKELMELIDEAHARGLYVILDIVLNHAARVFDYVRENNVMPLFSDPSLMQAPLGSEPSIQWLNGQGVPQPGWVNEIPAGAQLSPDDALFPVELQRADFFRRRGNKLSDDEGAEGFVKGDFGVMRQLVVEYQANGPDQRELREAYGITPVLNILIRIHQYLMAKFDVDGFRIDTVKYVHPKMVEVFGNAVREFALSIGKKNFFTFGEVYDDEHSIANFIGRNSTDVEGYGIDAALDFPLFFTLPAVARGTAGVETIRKVFSDRKAVEDRLLSTHGEAGRFFVTFLDNHDQHVRFNQPLTAEAQVEIGLAALFCLQGIPCLYYGTEQGLDGTKDAGGQPDLGSLESVREALWGKEPAFDQTHKLYKRIQELTELRNREPALRYGRLYFREVSGNGQDFGYSEGKGGILAFSRILNNQEVLFVANTHTTEAFSGFVLADLGLNRTGGKKKVAFSNNNKRGGADMQLLAHARFFKPGQPVQTGEAAALFVELEPMEVQVWVPDVHTPIVEPQPLVLDTEIPVAADSVTTRDSQRVCG